jgi:hypothetical protein
MEVTFTATTLVLSILLGLAGTQQLLSMMFSLMARAAVRVEE